MSSLEFNSMEEVVAASRKLDAAKAEGFVVRDANFKRVKVIDYSLHLMGIFDMWTRRC